MGCGMVSPVSSLTQSLSRQAFSCVKCLSLLWIYSLIILKLQVVSDKFARPASYTRDQTANCLNEYTLPMDPRIDY